MSFNFLYTTATLTRTSLRQNKHCPPPTTNYSIQFATLWMYYQLQQKLRNKTVPNSFVLPTNKEVGYDKYPIMYILEKDLNALNLCNKTTEFHPNVIIE